MRTQKDFTRKMDAKIRSGRQHTEKLEIQRLKTFHAMAKLAKSAPPSFNPNAPTKVERQDGRLSVTVSVPLVQTVDGQEVRNFSPTVTTYLEDEPKRKLRKAIKAMRKVAEYTVYMGYATDDIEAQIELAHQFGIEIFHLTVPEAWGYGFIAVKSRTVNLEGETLHYNPFDEIDFGREFSVTENDFRQTKIYLSQFLIAGKELEPGEWPIEIRLQMTTLGPKAVSI